MSKLGYPWRSVHRDDLQAWLIAGWSFSMPDFDKRDHYVIEWRAGTAPVEPNRVSETTPQEDAHGSAGADGEQQQRST